ncbi:dimethylarginine dimethylaminohydrolase family protein [Metamycoplasma hyosynoviae]|uniref:Arginine deiminase family protein n=1 Tax=Metamycoplasma hyosynoviae TaxID=29559 RepID=A0AAP4ALN0_9BACT|nr:arginine deiminase family protein [Metamycoplasma hyosynoviae]MDC8914773.1 arginine deiminase family protein [Metamycoplasma hyosynoviae]MDD7897081.1 arginine deiminase family protein [Metamycoplasma hyosynoviae]MDI3047697.1 arginine deiminase family protein [Metamycoplasma hyosynoviae]MDI3102739.1 arginine deiminase family protein [Metamycoplasma hyosynoviae]MDI3117795.1 arginine deiminase family protein [Metamycoplasma hyosynoviae]
MKKFNNVIVRIPAASMVNGITSAPELGKPDYAKACLQHKDYISKLEACGVKVTIAPKDEQFPDSCFVEDTAVIVPGEFAILTNPGAKTRNGEKHIALPYLQKFFDEKHIYKIEAPGTVDGGDVMMVGDTYFIGMSERTNDEGIRQFFNILAKHGKKCYPVPMTEMLHLKTGVNYLEHNNLLISGEFIDYPIFNDFNKIVVPKSEGYAANCIWMNETVIVPEGYPTVLKAIQDLGIYKVVTCDTSEFKKLDGGLSCLSLRF